jgi:putative hydrolase of the HAD superfamily
MIRAVIFDLDNCLAAADEVGAALYQPAFDAIRTANRGHLPKDVLDQAVADVWRHPLDWVAERHGFSKEMRDAGWRAFVALEATQPMRGYGDLASIAELPGMRFLVTSGFRKLQESKIRLLKLAPLFTAIHIDAIDEPDRLGKQGLFEQIMRGHALRPAEVLIVGDSADSEIAVGNRLGIRTVQTLRPGVPRTEKAMFHVKSLTELRPLLDR